jgi:putative tryptophan/tyrosine transport system substrate-binding protein
MRRRDFIVGGTVAWALPAVGQQHGMPVIGYLGPESPERFASRVAAFREGLAEAGYVEGRNVGIEFRWADGLYSRLPALAADLANRQVSLIAAPGGAPMALAAKAASHTIPVVFEMGGDPITLGVVESLARPGGHVTGVSSLSVEVSRKRLEFMHELLPRAGAFAVVINPTSPTAGSQLRNLHAAAESLRVQLAVVHASTEAELDAAFEAVPRLQAGGLVFTSDPYFANRSQQLAALAGRYDVPAITQSRDFPIAGGLMSYGGDFRQSHRQAGVYAGRILNGEKPADLAVQQVTKLELLINRKAASSLGITFPASLEVRADAVID